MVWFSEGPLLPAISEPAVHTLRRKTVSALSFPSSSNHHQAFAHFWNLPTYLAYLSCMTLFLVFKQLFKFLSGSDWLSSTIHEMGSIPFNKWKSAPNTGPFSYLCLALSLTRKWQKGRTAHICFRDEVGSFTSPVLEKSQALPLPVLRGYSLVEIWPGCILHHPSHGKSSLFDMHPKRHEYIIPSKVSCNWSSLNWLHIFLSWVVTEE